VLLLLQDGSERKSETDFYYQIKVPRADHPQKCNRWKKKARTINAKIS